jgi:hypothetical protein
MLLTVRRSITQRIVVKALLLCVPFGIVPLCYVQAGVTKRLLNRTNAAFYARFEQFDGICMAEIV